MAGRPLINIQIFITYKETRVTATYNNITLLFDSNEFLKEFLVENRALILSELDSEMKNFSMIDLDKLPREPVDFKEVLMRWLIAVNRPRLENGENMIMTFDLIKKCPIWRTIPLPLRKLPLQREAINKPASVTTVQTKMSSIKGFNRKQRKK